MKCLFTYKWVKLPRAHIPTGKGLMGSFLRLASRAAFRPGKARYCGYTNDVNAGSWVGGIVGLKSILGIKDRKQVLNVMERLVEMGFITCSLNTQTKKLTYTINDWIMECSGDTCPTGTIYTTDPATFWVVAFDRAGQVLKAFGGQGAGLNQFGLPNGIEVDSAAGTLLVVDGGNNRVLVFAQ